jgi:hypothetical protein
MATHRLGGFRPVLRLLALLVLVPALAGCGQTATDGGDSPLSVGWTWYHDASYPFQAHIPSGWRAGHMTTATGAPTR